MLRIISIFLIFSILLIPAAINQSEGLQQLAGKMLYQLEPGETMTLQWGLISDDDDNDTLLELRAEGEGAELVSFPKTIVLAPGERKVFDVTVSVPDDYPTDVVFKVSLYAKQRGTQEGPTVLNIQMKKYLDIEIGNPPEPVLIQAPSVIEEPEQEQESEKEEEESAPKGFTINAPAAETQEEGGGCLISTATYGSEMAPQVQLLREIRDNALLKTGSGSAFMTGFNSFYYSFSPTIADLERQSPIFKEVVKISITPLISSLSILSILDIHSEQEVLGYGVGVILLNIGMYFVAPAILIKKIKNKITYF